MINDISASKSPEFIVDEYLGQNNRLYSDEIIETVHELNKRFNSEIVFCGSLGLTINKLLNREVHDVDCLLLNEYDGGLGNKSDDIKLFLPINNGGSFDFILDGNLVRVEKFTRNNIHIDLFHHEKVNETKYLTVDFHGVNIKVELPLGAIKAKQEYCNLNQLTTRDKHIKDLEYIKTIMDIKIPEYNNDNNLPW